MGTLGGFVEFREIMKKILTAILEISDFVRGCFFGSFSRAGFVMHKFSVDKGEVMAVSGLGGIFVLKDLNFGFNNARNLHGAFRPLTGGPS